MPKIPIPPEILMRAARRQARDAEAAAARDMARVADPRGYDAALRDVLEIISRRIECVDIEDECADGRASELEQLHFEIAKLRRA